MEPILTRLRQENAQLIEGFSLSLFSVPISLLVWTERSQLMAYVAQLEAQASEKEALVEQIKFHTSLFHPFLFHVLFILLSKAQSVRRTTIFEGGHVEM